MSAFGIGRPGQRVLDLGTGTGSLARGLALRGCDVTGLDPSAPMLAEAQRLDQAAGVSTRYVEATAEQTGLPDNAFDVVTAGQCWHWFDRPAAAREARRVLVAGGTLAVCHFDWLRLPGNMVEATEYLIRMFNPHWRLGEGAGIYPRWPLDVAVAGFTDIETFSYDEPAIYSHEAWRGRIRASAGVAASLGRKKVADFDRLLADILSSRFPEEPMAVPHRVWAMICRSPSPSQTLP